MRNIENVVKRLLVVFEKHEIHATWATVGLLYFKDFERLNEGTKDLSIPYKNDNYSPFPITGKKYENIPFEIISAQKEIGLILNAKNQELASHTFSHYYTLEAGQTIENFQFDTAAMQSIGKELNHEFKSIVFPRNQINTDYLSACFASGLRAYRGNQLNKLWSNSFFLSESIVKKGKRYLDAYYNVSPTKGLKLTELENNEGLINIPASRFLRPSSGNNILEKRKVNRIISEMENAAKNGEIYHLWWHPHNFAEKEAEHFDQLAIILESFKKLNAKYGFESMNMGEIGAYAGK